MMGTGRSRNTAVPFGLNHFGQPYPANVKTEMARALLALHASRGELRSVPGAGARLVRTPVTMAAAGCRSAIRCASEADAVPDDFIMVASSDSARERDDNAASAVMIISPRVKKHTSLATGIAVVWTPERERWRLLLLQIEWTGCAPACAYSDRQPSCPAPPLHTSARGRRLPPSREKAAARRPTLVEARVRLLARHLRASDVPGRRRVYRGRAQGERARHARLVHPRSNADDNRLDLIAEHFACTPLYLGNCAPRQCSFAYAPCRADHSALN